jgi:3-dehydroquinate synthase
VVVADTDTLSTLPARELAAGLAEVVKYGLIRDRPFFEWLEANMARLVRREPEALGYAIERSCANKADVVGSDELETGPRALLNLGHTFGHAIEAGTGYGAWLHGEAVAAGMLLAAKLSQRLGLLAARDVARVDALLRAAGLRLDPPALGLARYLELMGHDKKVAGGRIHFVLLKRIGEATVSGEVPRAALADVLEAGAVHAGT